MTAQTHYAGGIEPGIYPDIPDTEYHAAKDILSSSGARRLITSTPRKFYEEMTTVRPYNPAFEIGHAAHTLMLTVGDPFEVVDADSWRTKDAKAARDAALQAGNTPLLAKEYAQVRAMADAILDHPVTGELFTRNDTTSEQSLYWKDEQTGVACRARPDLAVNDWSLIVDYKTTVSADPREFAKSIAKYGYHQQQAWYCEAVEILTGIRPEFVFVCQEKTPPYEVSLIQLDADAVRIGGRLNEDARSIYAACMDSGVWPSYPTSVQVVGLPAWALRQADQETGMEAPF
ncbi:MAG: PD-(D/E)XK nuclease-like domain-containing protein [Actinomycetaceae bacterium]|nr:PD-(D/E)XK nuclease-like domain-containing protein [Actinomycetaceae bacterium]